MPISTENDKEKGEHKPVCNTSASTACVAEKGLPKHGDEDKEALAVAKGISKSLKADDPALKKTQEDAHDPSQSPHIVSCPAAESTGTGMDSSAERSGNTHDDVEPLPPALLRSAHPPTAPTTPGAYRAAPGVSSERIGRVSYQDALVHPEQEPSSSFLPPGAATVNTGPTLGASTTDSNLVEARMVDEERGTRTVAVPHQDSPETKERDRKRSLAFLVCFLVLIGIVFLILGLTGVLDKKEIAATPTLTPPPTPPPEDVLWNKLFGSLTNSSSTLQALQDPLSPQSRALDWMLEGDYEYPIERLRQRYALATIYYSFNGKLWKHKTHWLDHQKHECEWFATGSRNVSDVVGALTVYPSPCHRYEPDNTTDNNDDTQDPMYARLWLRNNTINGTLPDELYWLTNLNSIDLAYTDGSLAGTVSTTTNTANDYQSGSLS